MAKPSLRDRFYTPPVAHAITSPLGIVLAGAGLAVGLAVGLPVVAAIGLGAVAYAGRVAVAIPKENAFDGINPFVLDDPWRTYVWQAKRSQREFADVVKHTHGGPLKERLAEIGDHVDSAVDECWQVAQSGQQIAKARARIDVGAITGQMAALPTTGPTGAPAGAPGAPPASGSLGDAARALQSQLDSAKRMDQLISAADDRLRLLDAQLGEVVTSVLELSTRPQGAEELQSVGADIASIVTEMEHLRQALDETDAVGAQALAGSQSTTLGSGLPGGAIGPGSGPGAAPAPPAPMQQAPVPQQVPQPQPAPQTQPPAPGVPGTPQPPA
jgi:hypothetical protein